MISGQSLACPKGASLTFEIDMDTGSDLTGATAQWALCESWFDNAKVYLTKTGVGDGLFIGQDAGVWKITVSLAPTDTLDIPSGLLYHDCKVLLQSGDVEDVANGPFFLDPSVNVLYTDAPITRNVQAAQALGAVTQTATGTVVNSGGWDDSSTVPVIIYTGESNAGGKVPNTGIPTTAHPEVKILNNTNLTFESLAIGVNNLIDHQDIPDNSSHGWELEMAVRAAASAWGTTPVYLIKTGQGSSTAGQWTLGNTYMNKFTDRWNAAAAAIAALGKTPAPVIWMSLGMNDALAGTASGLFQSQMLHIISDMRTILGIYAPIMMTKFVPAYSAYEPNIISIQANALWSYLIDTASANSHLLGDNVHWDETGMQILADAMTDLTIGSQIGLGTIFATNRDLYSGTTAASGTVWDATAKGTGLSLRNGRLDAQGNGANWSTVRATTGHATGKWYCEIQPFGAVGGCPFIGVMDDATTGASALDVQTPANCGMTRDDGFANASGFAVGGSGGFGTIADGDIIGIAYDATARSLWLSKNNSWLSSGDPAAGTNPYMSGPFNTASVFPCTAILTPFARSRLITAGATYSPPSGFSIWG